MKKMPAIFWDVPLCSLVEVYLYTASIFIGELSTAWFFGLLVNPEDGGSLFFRSFPTIQLDYTT
jgi:hypothetical protein